MQLIAINQNSMFKLEEEILYYNYMPLSCLKDLPEIKVFYLMNQKDYFCKYYILEKKKRKVFFITKKFYSDCSWTDIVRLYYKQVVDNNAFNDAVLLGIKYKKKQVNCPLCKGIIGISYNSNAPWYALCSTCGIKRDTPATSYFIK